MHSAPVLEGRSALQDIIGATPVKYLIKQTVTKMRMTDTDAVSEAEYSSDQALFDDVVNRDKGAAT